MDNAEPVQELDVAPEPVLLKLLRWADPRQTNNIADEIPPTVLSSIGARVVEEYNLDNNSRDKWYKEAKTALDLALQRAKPKTHPWDGASNVILPIITEAADQFAARAYPAIVDNGNVVKGKVYGDDNGRPRIDPTTGQPMMQLDPATGQPVPVFEVPPGEKQRRSDRVGEHMTWQLLEEQPEWEEDTDKLLHVLPIVGCHFRKTYFDPELGRNMSVGVSALNLVVDYWAKSTDTVPRATEELFYYPYEIEEKRRSKLFLDVEFGQAVDAGLDRDKAHKFLEQHRRWDLDEDGYAEPYIITVHEESQKVVRIVAGYDREGIRLVAGSQDIARVARVQMYTKYDFLPNKEGGFYGQGFGQLLKPLNEAANTTVNMMIDSAHLQTLGGGFIGKGLSVEAGTMKMGLGQWKFVNAAGNDVRAAVVPLVHKGPSPVLFQLLGMMVESSKSISSVKDVLTGEVKAQSMSPTVFMSMVEQGLKVFTSIWKRVRRSLRSEFDKCYRLNRIYLEEQTSYQRGDLWKTVSRADYEKGSGVEPISDSNMVVDVQKMARASFLQQFLQDPACDHIEILRRMFDAASIPDPDNLFKKDGGPDPAMLAMLHEREMRQIEVKASAMAKMAQAIKALAEADEKVMAPFAPWFDLQLQMMRTEIDGLEQKRKGPAAPGIAGPDAGGVQPMAPPPGDEGLSSLVEGLPGDAPPAARGPMGTGQSA